MNDLTPYSPDGGDLAPISAPDLVPGDVWQVPEPDYISEQYPAPSDTVFGQPLAPGATPESVQHNLHALAQAFQGDMQQLGISRHFASAAAQWFVNSAMQPPPMERVAHRYDMTGYRFPASDRPYIDSFLNAMDRVGASEREVKTALLWVARLGQPQQRPQHQQAATLDDLSDAEFKIVKARAARDLENAEGILKQKYGDRYPQVMATVHTYIKNLPAADRQFLETAVAQGGMMLANSPETVVRLYEAAVGQSVSKSDLAGQIAQIENFMRQNRKAYNADVQMQERLRVLYGLRDG